MRVAVVTVRVPVALHAALKEAAYQERTSLNKFCVEALACAAKFPLRRNVQRPLPRDEAGFPGA